MKKTVCNKTMKAVKVEHTINKFWRMCYQFSNERTILLVKDLWGERM